MTVCIPDPDNPTRYVEIRGIAEVAEDVGRSYVNYIAREYMGEAEVRDFRYQG